jgi:threonine dehydrogenase-like Zn-dependent dehydrogenase
MNELKHADVIWLDSPGNIRIHREELGDLGAHQILCKTIVTAISPGTEIAAFNGLPPLRAAACYPRLLGYCNVAEVIDVGSLARKHKIGDRVLSFTSHRSAFILDENEVLYRVAHNADPGDMATTYLFHLGYNAVLRSNIVQGSKVLVIGLGALGLTSLAMAVRSGALVYGVTNHSKPSEIARNYGALGTYTRYELEKLLLNEDCQNFDVVISTTSCWQDWHLALKSLRQMGLIAVVGFPGRGELPPTQNPLMSEFFYMKQIRIEAVGYSPKLPDERGFCRFNERSNIEFIGDQIQLGKISPKQIISGHYDCHKIEEAYLELKHRKNSPITFLLKWDQ